MQEILKQQSEKYLARYPKIFFCHVPKCAGVSLSNAIYSSIYPSFLKATKFTGSIDLKSSRVCSELLNVDMMTARETHLIFHLNDPKMIFTHGHCIARPSVVGNFAKDWHFLTILRNPVDRFISEFVYNKFKKSEWLKHDDDIETYVDSEKGLTAGLTYAKYFSGYTNPHEIIANRDTVIEEAVANIRRFSVFGTLDNMDKWQARFNQTFNTTIKIANKNASPNQTASSDITGNAAIMDKIHTLCDIDNAIYSRVTALVEAE
ncbi:sulfotransferase family 2 domain-containing protein [Alteromonas pelagimontana]|uniref:Sulfotransferase family 2 domain-containing protein n=1 Tax=Alteromonas pelagimontana TaxID=1858656 RepID=A0A6M4MC13_9ALTE|nr:sulfotransferase family 2 domain-containing protein [Alteromonas pelagimontana]QJR80190.1 sulfotransferase family 2 domain-containing protein [Alteromonas pelagimontana]